MLWGYRPKLIIIMSTITVGCGSNEKPPLLGTIRMFTLADMHDRICRPIH